jgi:heat shock protein HtpX
MWNQLKTILLFGVLSALLLAIGGAVAPEALGVFVVIALVMNLGAYFFSDKLVLAMSGARELSRARRRGSTRWSRISPAAPGCRCRACS